VVTGARIQTVPAQPAADQEKALAMSQRVDVNACDRRAGRAVVGKPSDINWSARRL
jgi:hypothetical protein